MLKTLETQGIREQVEALRLESGETDLQAKVTCQSDRTLSQGPLGLGFHSGMVEPTDLLALSFTDLWY